MAERLNTFTVESDAVQGAGSWVKFRRLAYGTVQEARRLVEKKELTAAEDERQTRKVITEAVADWNWVDDHGQPMPTPAAGLDVGVLTGAEVDWLMSHASGAAQAKN